MSIFSTMPPEAVLFSGATVRRFLNACHGLPGYCLGLRLLNAIYCPQGLVIFRHSHRKDATGSVTFTTGGSAVSLLR
jgi:hypothetical protein